MVYLCNQAVRASREKIALRLEEVTCKNCKLALNNPWTWKNIADGKKQNVPE